MRIRAMTLEDVPAVLEIGKLEPGFQVSDSSQDRFWSQDQIERWILADMDVLLVAEMDDVIVGFVLTTIHRPTGKATWENQAVHPSYRQRGVAAELMQEMLNRLMQKGVSYVHFLVRNGNQAADYYRRAGFQPGFDFTWFGKHL